MDIDIIVDTSSLDISLDKNSSLVQGGNQFDAVLSETEVANRFTDLSDVSINENSLNSTKTNFVVVYNHTIGQFELVDPDQVLVAAASTISNVGYVGLPTAFINTLDTSLDQKIDLDGGSF
jgi:hypothetical protein